MEQFLGNVLVHSQSPPIRRAKGARRLVPVVVVLVPIAFRAPAVLVLVPPAMLLTPATLARGVQFTTLVIGLAAVPSVPLDGLVEIMLSMRNSPLAAFNVFCVHAWRYGEEQGCGKERA